MEDTGERDRSVGASVHLVLLVLLVNCVVTVLGVLSESHDDNDERVGAGEDMYEEDMVLVQSADLVHVRVVALDMAGEEGGIDSTTSLTGYDGVHGA